MIEVLVPKILELALQLSPAVAAKFLEWLKQFQAGPFKTLHIPGWRGKLIKWALNILISALITALTQVVEGQTGLAAPTLVNGIGMGIAGLVAYGIARPKTSTPTSQMLRV